MHYHTRRTGSGGSVPFALRGQSSVRTVLSAAVAGAIGLAPVVFVASPAHALVDPPKYSITTSSAPIVETATTTIVSNNTVVTQKKATVYVNLSAPAEEETTVSLTIDTTEGAGGTALGAANTNTNRDFTWPPADGADVVIPAGEQSGSLDIELYDDKLDEDATQNFVVKVDTVSPELLPLTTAARSTRVYIADDEATPSVSIGDAGDATEGTAEEDDDGNDLVFPLTLSGRSEKAVTVELSTANGTTSGDTYGATGGLTATTGVDYLTLNKSVVTIPKYAVSAVAVVDVKPDAVVEASPEKLTATIATPTNATLGTPVTGTGNIVDDETAPSVGLSYAALENWDDEPLRSSAEGNTGETAKTINVKLSGTSTIPVRLNYEFVTTGDYPANNGKDYKGTGGSLTIAPGQTTATIPVTILADTIFEPNDETFGIKLTSPNGSVAAASIANPFAFTITDDDTGPVTFAAGNVEVQEGNSGTTVAKVPVTLSAPLDIDTTLEAVVSGVSADPEGVNEGDTAGRNDYDPPTGGTVTIKAGETVGHVEIVVNGDTVFEKNETATVAIGIGSADQVRVSATPAPGTTHTSLVTIANDDAAPTFAFSEVAAPEGGLVRIGGTITGIAQDAYTISFATAASGSATADAAGTIEAVPATPGVDYETTPAIADFTVPRGKSGTVTVDGRMSTNLASIYLLPDDIDEPTETFTVTATEKGTTLVGFAKSAGTYRITDDPSDLPPAASLQDESIGEWEQSVDVGVDLIANGEATSTTQTIKIPYRTVDGSAKAGEDYVAAEGVLEIKPGDSPKINVKIINDKWAEDNETFEVRFGSPLSPVGASVVKSTGEVIIKSDDKTDPVKPSLSVTGPAKGVGGATISGKAAPNSTVELWGAMLPETDPVKGKWLAEVKSDDQGWFKFPSRSLSQGWVFAVQATDMVSSPVTVKVTQNPSFAASSAKKGKLSVSVAGNPKAAGQAVTVQRYTGGKWVNVGKGTTTATGWKGTFSFKSKTKLTLRAQVGGNTDLGINSGWSAQKKVTIK
ncbi:Calx-beta domain-containing protein [Actinoplanes xinjiangensis]|uniref:Calx-beta domain-containing protein n=1 Tax=Actinoplanes xinjiangensis TaxID=512350 RepID=UPI003436F46E